MTIHEFGKENSKIIVLIHPSVVMWDYFEYVIPYLEGKYHLVIPALAGYDDGKPGDYTSVEEIAAELEDWLNKNANGEIACIYGCSMGGSIVIKMLADDRLNIQSAVIDGGITPYQLPYIITRLIAVKDFLMIGMGKLGGIKLLEKAFATDEYSREDLKYVAKILRMMSAKTIWRTFESCNNYTMPKQIVSCCKRIEYWFADAEEKARKRDIAYIRDHFTNVRFRKIRNVGHGGLAALYPKKLARGLDKLCMEANTHV